MQHTVLFVLGLKGELSQAELHFLKARMRGGVLNKARRGEREMGPPVGLVYRNDGTVGLDPDQEVQAALRLVFDSFTRTGSAMQTVCYFREQGLRFPRRIQLSYPRRNSRYSVPQMILALVYPIILGLDRIETASFLRSNGTFQYLTGLPSFPDPQTLRRFLLQAPHGFWEQLHRVNDRLLQKFIHMPEHRSRLIFDLDSTVVTVFGHQDGAEVGYNPRDRGKRSYKPVAVYRSQLLLSLGY